MKKVLIRIGQFVRLLDEQNNISLTNLAMYVAVYKMATTGNPSFADIGVFLISAANYSYKKMIG